MIAQRDSITQSPWQKETLSHPTISKTGEANFDVIIIGAGITGITTALLLQKQGKNCLVIDAGNVGFGTTGGTTAHINTFFDSTYPEIASNFNKLAAKLVADAGKRAIEMICGFTATYQIECDLETKVGYLYAETENEVEQLNQIFDSAIEAGVDVDRTTSNGLPISFLQSIKFNDQAQFHPTKYLHGLVSAYINLGGSLKENTFIIEIKEEENHCTAISANEKFTAYDIVFATHIPPGINKFSFRCAPYRSYALGIRVTDESQYPDDLSYDMQEPYHYFRTHLVDDEKILILGGADHKTGHDDPQNAFEDLENYASQHFIIKDIPYRWSSQYYVPTDGLPYIGRMNKADDHIYVATGFNGNGMTWGTIAGELISDLILTKPNAFAELFDPCRVKPIAGFKEFVKENADVAYHFLIDRFKIEDLASFREIGRDEGKIIEFQGQKLAVYKNKEGIITTLNPTCTHAGCLVNFNSEEKSWDCPCHGARFDVEGRVLCGPPLANLEQINIG